MKTSNQKGFSAIEGLLILVIVSVLGGVGWFVWHSKNNVTKTQNDTTSSIATPTKTTIAVKPIEKVSDLTTTDKTQISDLILVYCDKVAAKDKAANYKYVDLGLSKVAYVKADYVGLVARCMRIQGETFAQGVLNVPLTYVHKLAAKWETIVVSGGMNLCTDFDGLGLPKGIAKCTDSAGQDRDIKS